MNTIRYNLFPGGVHHCLTMSYDDGNPADIRLAQIFRENGIAGTFHLNSGSLNRYRQNGTKMIFSEEIPEIYAGHEVSCHTCTHPALTDGPDISVLEEILEDRRILEAACGYVVRGMSYPFGDYDERVIALCRAAGMEYSRTVRSTNRFGIPENFMEWHPTCHHNRDIMDRLTEFYEDPDSTQMKLFYVWGHSYEFDREGNWHLIEEFSKAAAHRPDTWYATNIQIVDYINAVRSLRVNVERSKVYNPTAQEVWFTLNDTPFSVKPGELFCL